MNRVCVVTATRAEYGVLKNIIQEIERDKELELYFVVTGAHLSDSYGMTIQEIIDDGVSIAETIEILDDRNDELGITYAMARATAAFGEMFYRVKPKMLVVVGDRYELLPICQCAVVCGIPIAHISGGEITEGAIDDVIRHAITKLSYLHFPACEQYRQRIIQMGEEPDRVFNFGDVGVENIKKTKFMSRNELEESLDIKLDKPYACVTFHPVTLEKGMAEVQIKELLKALREIKDMQFIITKANADAEGMIINNCIDQVVSESVNCFTFYSLGIKRYLSLLKECEFVIGNSSSGIIEAPSLGIPTINIGNRQKGRLQASSVINCEPRFSEILKAIEIARSKEFKQLAKITVNPYGEGNTSSLIVRTIKEEIKQCGFSGKKFYDIASESIVKN